jgi:multidrug efflux system membrane fusion protein
VSPIDGQVSRYYLTLGNLVNQDQTLLTTVVSMDPLYAYFDMDERNLLRIRQAINDGRLKSRRPSAPVTPQQIAAVFGIAAANASAPAWPALVDTTVAAAPEQFNDIPVLLGLPGEDGYPHQGIINFANNQVNPSTGSISVRGLFGNPKPANGVRLMSPGMFVRIRLPIGPPHPAILVIDRAIQSDQGKKYVYIVGPDNKTRRSKELVTGALQPDGLRVIMSGLQPTDRVVVSKIQQVRDNMEVQVQEVDMPSFSEAGGPARPAGGNN